MKTHFGASLCFSLLLIISSQNLRGNEMLFKSMQNWPMTLTDKIDLAAFNKKSNQLWVKQKDFSINKTSYVNVWGRGQEIPGVYFNEILSPCFTRRIEFSASEFDDGNLLWIFTGDAGGVTVEITGRHIRVYQRYYDSFGFSRVEDGNILADRHPEKIFLDHKTTYSGELKNITTEYTHHLMFRVYLNDSLVISQPSFIDLTRMQIKYTGLNANINASVFHPQSKKVHIAVDEKKEYQEIIGWGGITSIPAYHLLSAEGKEKWFNLLKEYNLLIQREYPNGKLLKPDYSNWDGLENASVHYYGDNFPNGELSDFDYNKKIVELGGMIIFEFWELPQWTKSQDGNINYTKYTEAIIDYCKKSAAKTGVPPQIVGIQNEVVQKPEVWHQMTLTLREALDRNGFSKVKIHMHNASSLEAGIKAKKAFYANRKVWDIIDYTATNEYDYQKYFFDPDQFSSWIDMWNKVNPKTDDKPFLSTELCINASHFQAESYKLAFIMAELYHKNMVEQNASSIMYCWLLLNCVQPSYTATRSLFTIDEKNNFVPAPSSYQLRTFGAFSRHLPAGMKRVETTSPDPNIMVSAYSNGSNQTMIVLNRGLEPYELSLDNGFSAFTDYEIVSATGRTTISLLNHSEKIIVNPGNIVTFYKK